MIEANAPGKLYIAGEYAVVEPGEPAVLIAVDRVITVRLSETSASADAGQVRSSVYGRTPLVWVRDPDTGRVVVARGPLDYVCSAIDTVEQLRAARGLAPRYFDLDITSELDDESGRKFGLGSSGAVTVAVIDALNKFYNLQLSRLDRCKLALLATVEIAPRASGGDLAASMFGGWIRYTSPDRAAIRASRHEHGVSAALDDDAIWVGFGVTPLPAPEQLQLLVGWTGRPASTEHLVAEVGRSAVVASHDAKASSQRRTSDSFLQQSRACVADLVSGLRTGDSAPVLRSVRAARSLLQQLGDASNIVIETAQLRDLCDVAEAAGASAKPSGAGGGDCGVVLAPIGTDIDGILREWDAHDILKLPVAVHPPTGGAND